jgi:hypothetical protein
MDGSLPSVTIRVNFYKSASIEACYGNNTYTPTSKLFCTEIQNEENQ